MSKRFLALSFLAAAAFAWTGCTVDSTERPPISGPSEFALSFGVTATPDSISQDGGSQSAVVIRAYGPNGGAQAGVPFRLDMFVNGSPVDYGTLSSKSVTTNAAGLATVTYTAPAALPAGAALPTCSAGIFDPALPGGCLSIVATPVGNNFVGDRSQSVQIHLVPTTSIGPPALTPTPSFTFSPASPAANTAVQFDASASCPGPAQGSGCAANSGTITAYDWTFSYGSPASGRLATQSFPSAGTFSVTLTVTNDRGVKASTTKPVTVGAGAPPSASFLYSPKPVAFGATANFDASNSSPGIGHALTGYAWNWGDGQTTAATASPYASHVFQAANCTLDAGKCTFTVVLTVSDESGQTATTPLDIQVGP